MDNTKETVGLALKVAKERNINTIVVASCSGDTASLLKNNQDINVVCVTHAYGYAKPGEIEITEIKRDELEKAGMKVLTTTHVLSGAERGISNKFNGAYPVEIMANTLRIFGQGTKVCVEITVMALDSGLIPFGKPVIAIGGTIQGADTAVIITPAHANNIFDSKIHQVICMPSRF